MSHSDPEVRRAYINEYKRRKRLERGLQKVGRKPLTEEARENSKLVRAAYEKEWRKAYFDLDVRKRLLWSARSRAKKRGVDFSLTLDDIVVPSHCPILGIELANSRPRGDSRRDIASLDRVDPTKGYIPGNVEVISWLANTMKNNATKELLVKFSKEMLRRYESDVGL